MTRLRTVAHRGIAFTLIELIVVMGVMVVIISILLPSLSRARKAALKAQLESEDRYVQAGIGAEAAPVTSTPAAPPPLATIRSFDATVSVTPRLSVGTASERSTPKDKLPFTVPSGRLVAFGNADWLSNASLSSPGNSILAFAAINWLVDRDTQLQLPPRPIEKFQLTLTTAQLGRLRLTLLLALPAAAALLGLLVYWNRRR